jgi:uncharacterized protein (DUF4415 family)
MSNENFADGHNTRAILAPDGMVMIEQPNGGLQKADSQTEWDRIVSLTDQEIEDAARADPDAQPIGDDFWLNARVVMPAREPKRHQGMRLDVDVLDWFKAQGPGWQTRMNAVLKSYVETRKRQG